MASIAVWARVADPHDGSTWKLALTDYDLCPIVAGHTYQAKAVWDATASGTPLSIYVEDQGADGAGALWTGQVLCTDPDQGLLPEDRKLFEGDTILSGVGGQFIGINSNGNVPFNGTIDWVRVLAGTE